MFPRLKGTSMSIPQEGPTIGAVPAGPAAPVAPQHVHADDHWPICRCGHPMHPNKIELRRGVRLERYECPRQRWWNKWFHPYIWQPPRH
jgi:hypothetical protein